MEDRCGKTTEDLTCLLGNENKFSLPSYAASTKNNMLKTNNLSLHYSSDNKLFKNINISLDSSSNKKVALVGRNGCGKSSLLKILNKEIKPTSGSIDFANEIIGYLPQVINLPDFKLVGEYLESKLDESWMEYKIDMALADVGLADECIIKEIDDLSGGEKVRVALAGILLDEPTILLLDEPTNNLDSEGVEWLEKFINSFYGSIILVSHDRYLINNTVDNIWEIDLDTLGLKIYDGNYDKFVEEKEKCFHKSMTEYKSKEREINRIEKWLTEHEFHPKYRFGSLVMSQKTKLEKLKNARTDKPAGNTKIKMQKLESKKRGLIINVKINSKKFGRKEILNNISFKIHKDKKILLSGPNGSGKTTLLQIIYGEDNDYDGNIELGENVTIGYLRQFSTLNENKSILDEFENKTKIINPKSRSTLATYSFFSDQVMRKVGMLSFGQRKRLELAIILAQNPTLLILDEPTNHLDIYTREELEKFILSQSIPMIIVSHDRYFIEKIGVDKCVELCIDQSIYKYQY
ncbi:MAG: ABC-F family ATP-binding cassette domain-containing protein [bacterium]